EVAACPEEGKPRLHGWSICFDDSDLEEGLDGQSNLRRLLFVALRQHPGEFAERREANCQQGRLAQSILCDARLIRIVFQCNAEQDIRVGDDLHRFPAQASSVIFLISSIVRTGLSGCARRPKMDSMPFSRGAACIVALPPGNVSTTILPPGFTPRC